MQEFYDLNMWNHEYLTNREPQRPQLSVLLVEDDLFFQAKFTSLLRVLDFDTRVDRASSAEVAKKLLDNRAIHYDLVIADQFLEGNETGMDLWNYCRYKYPKQQFLLTSGKDLQPLLTKSKDPMPEFLPKSCTNRQATDVLLEALSITTNKINLPEAVDLAAPAILKMTWDAKFIWILGLLYIGLTFYYLQFIL
ncbi:MAG: hypothetical protein AB7F59_13115 [Bdellovibrionales bacterium]